MDVDLEKRTWVAADDEQSPFAAIREAAHFQAKLEILDEEQRDCRALVESQRQEYLAAIEELRQGFREVLQDVKELKAATPPPVPAVQKALTSRKSVTSTASLGLATIGDLQRSQSSASSAAANTPPPPRFTVRLKTEDFSKSEVAEYEVGQSMWDAAFLSFFREVHWSDKAILIFGLIGNYTLQVLMLCVITFNMLDNPFPDERVEEMIGWRVQAGHHHAGFDEKMGDSQLHRLCNNDLWSFEQGEYEEMHNYLYKPIAGYLLSLLAIILWVLTTISEYRHVVEQALAIRCLPTVPIGESCIEARGGFIEIVGIYRHTRWGALLLLSVPRMLVVAAISVVGCKYLAQTASLHDIVLNAVALAFVLDVDEQLFSVLCTQRIRSLVAGLKPLPCARNRRPGEGMLFHALHRKDVVRYFLMAFLVGMAYYAFLLPFYHNIEGAALALCGGAYDFSYKGGDVDGSTVVLYDAEDWLGYCPSDYLERYYTSPNASLNMAVHAKEALEGFRELRERVVMSYAFRSNGNCAPGEVLHPVNLARPDDERVCGPVPKKLLNVLPTGVDPGESLPPKRCQQFRPHLGKGTCSSEEAGEACRWSWQSYHCEREPPGSFNRQACSNLATPSRAEVKEACDVWSSFNRENPFYNCQALQACTGYPNLDCFVMLGEFVIVFRETRPLNITRMPDPAVASVTSAALSLAAGVDESDIFTGSFWRDPRPEDPGQWRRMGFQFLFRRCPVTFFPAKFLEGNITARVGAAMLAILGGPGMGRADVGSTVINAVRGVDIGNTSFDTNAAFMAKVFSTYPWYSPHLP